jgi:hypothetical protein
VIGRARVWAAVAATSLLVAASCTGSDEFRVEPEAPDATDPAYEATAVVGEPLSPRLGSQQVWTGSTLLSYGGILVDSNLTTNTLASIDLATLEVTRVFEPPPFSASFGGDVLWVDDRVYFSGSECQGDEKDLGQYAENNECDREPVLATLDPDSGDWRTLVLPPETNVGVSILGSVPGVGVLATAGINPNRLWVRTDDGDWTELPEPPLQERRPADVEPRLAYFRKGSCVLGDTVVQFGAELLVGTASRDITAAVLDLGDGSERWRTSIRPELDTDAAGKVLCGDDAVVFSPITGPSGPVTRFSPGDLSWTSIGPSTAQLDGVEPPYSFLGVPGSTGAEVVYPGAPGVGSQIVDISTGEWRAGPPSPGMFENPPTWTGTGFVGVSATGTAGQFTTPEPMELPMAGTLFLFNVE